MKAQEINDIFENKPEVTYLRIFDHEYLFATIVAGRTSFALINIDEFDMLSKSQQPLLKHLISKADVKMRPPYGKAYEQRRRYASFIATTNNLRPLPDDKSGSRRFICIVVKEQRESQL